MRNGEDQAPPANGGKVGTEDSWLGPDLPSVGAVLIGSVFFATGGALLFTVIGTPLGILLFAVGLGLMLTPKERKK
jgi:hypothetical protein